MNTGDLLIIFILALIFLGLFVSAWILWVSFIFMIIYFVRYLDA